MQRRENYLGASLNAAVGRWQKGRDLQWFARDKDVDSNATPENSALEAELAEIRRKENNALASALGFDVQEQAVLGTGLSNFTKEEYEEATRRGTAADCDVWITEADTVSGVGFNDDPFRRTVHDSCGNVVQSTPFSTKDLLDTSQGGKSDETKSHKVQGKQQISSTGSHTKEPRQSSAAKAWAKARSAMPTSSVTAQASDTDSQPIFATPHLAQNVSSDHNDSVVNKLDAHPEPETAVSSSATHCDTGKPKKKKTKKEKKKKKRRSRSTSRSRSPGPRDHHRSRSPSSRRIQSRSSGRRHDTLSPSPPSQHGRRPRDYSHSPPRRQKRYGHRSRSPQPRHRRYHSRSRSPSHRHRRYNNRSLSPPSRPRRHDTRSPSPSRRRQRHDTRSRSNSPR